MRTTKRFTPKVLQRFEREGRGTGTYDQFNPWHHVGRGDPASSGRSHWHIWHGRQRHLLSDDELLCQLLVSMLPGVEDCLEQYPLSLESSSHPLLMYGEGNPLETFPGTIQLAKQQSIRHPRTHGEGSSAPWRVTTDLLVIGRNQSNHYEALAIASKPHSSLAKRSRELLQLEHDYWLCRQTPWLLITPELVDATMDDNLMRIACWITSERANPEDRAFAAQVVASNAWLPQTDLLQILARELNSMSRAQEALWQSIAFGPLHVDLRKEFKPHLPFQVIEREQFLALNPVFTRRSSWS